MNKTVEVEIDIEIARKMLFVAGYCKEARNSSDDEIFALVLDQMTPYGCKTMIKEKE